MGKKMKIVRINGFRIPGLKYPSKPLPDLLKLKNDDTELEVWDAPDATIIRCNREPAVGGYVAVRHLGDGIGVRVQSVASMLGRS